MNLPLGFHSEKVTDEVETAAEIVAENFQDDDEELINLTTAARIIGCSIQSLMIWTNGNNIPSEKHGKRRFIRTSVAETVRDLREIHGLKWKSYATWDIPFDNEQPVAAVVEKDDGNPLLEQLRERAEQCRINGRYEAAAEMFSLLVNLCEVG